MEHLDPLEIRTLLNSPEGKQLQKLLQQNSAETLHQASEAARTGNYRQVLALLKPAMEGSNGEALARILAQRFG